MAWRSAGLTGLAEKCQRVPQVGAASDEPVADLEPHHAGEVDRHPVVLGGEPVPGDHLAVEVERADGDDGVSRSGEGAEEAGETSPILGATHAPGAEFGEVLVDEVVRHQRADRVGIRRSERIEVPLHHLDGRLHLRDGTAARVWSNVPVAGPDETRSPWERDDWLSDHELPSFDSPNNAPPETESPDNAPPETESPNNAPPNNALPNNESPETEPPTTGSSDAAPRTQVVIAAGFAALLLLVGVVALLRNDEATPAASADTTATTLRVDGVELAPVTLPVAVGDDGEVVVVTPEPGSDAADPDLADLSDVADVEVGQVPVWSEWSIAVPTPLDAIATPTELVALTDSGFVHRVEFPSGRVRTVDVGRSGTDGQVVVGDDAIVVYSSRLLTVLRDDAPAEQIEMTDGVIFVQEWPGTGRFIVTTAASSGDALEQEFVLERDGALTPLEGGAFDEFVFWARSFLPSGELVINRPGGVYAIAPDQTVRRLSDGDLLATGARSFAVEECDAVLNCAEFVVDASTGERVPATLPGPGVIGFVDPTTRLSPDGRSIVFSDSSRGTGIRQIADTVTGAAVDIGRVDSIFYPDTWAADSSGLFSDEGGLIRFHARDPADVVVVVEDVGRVSAIGVRAAAEG